MKGEWGSKADWNFSENSSDLVPSLVPQKQYYLFTQFPPLLGNLKMSDVLKSSLTSFLMQAILYYQRKTDSFLLYNIFGSPLRGAGIFGDTLLQSQLNTPHQHKPMICYWLKYLIYYMWKYFQQTSIISPKAQGPSYSLLFQHIGCYCEQFLRV